MLVVCAMGSSLSTSAFAKPVIEVRSEGTCPSSEQVSAALTYLLKASAGEEQDHAPALPLLVTDLGPSYRATLAGQARAYDDASRDCEERARVVAVFAAVILEPPEIAAREKPMVETPRRRVELRVGALSDVALQASRLGFAWGGEIRAALLGRWLGLEIGAGAQTGTTLAWASYQASMTRFPIDLSLRGSLRGDRTVASASLGLAGAFFTLRGTGQALPVQNSGTRFDVGAVSMLSLALFPKTRLSPFATLHASLWPRPYKVVVDPVGQVGSTPQLWLGVTLGLALAL
jgi:hypothetical protein